MIGDYDGRVRELKRRADELNLVLMTEDEFREFHHEVHLIGAWTGGLLAAAVACFAVTLVAWLS